MTKWLQLDPGPESPRTARHFVAELLQAWDYTCIAESAALITSELASNSVRHTGQPYLVGLEDLGNGVRLSVEDHVAAPPVPRPAADDALDGRGMHIVEALADSWGTQLHGDGKIVWCTLAAVDRAPGFAQAR